MQWIERLVETVTFANAVQLFQEAFCDVGDDYHHNKGSKNSSAWVEAQ